MKRLLFLVSLLVFSTLASAAPINLNAATTAELAALPNVGAVKAKAIVDYRAANGCFKNVSDLLKINGVTQSDVNGMNDLVVVGICPRSRSPAASKAET
jgi:competence protein ComEA